VDEVMLEISGPFALFRHTRLYARALSTLLSRLTWCRTFRLEADCVLGKRDRIGRLLLQPGDPILPARELSPFDSKVEERFAKSFAKLAPAWDVVREPVAITVGTSLVFPDFALHHRATGERWLLEIVGYWTREYLEKKLAGLRSVQSDRLLICIDERHAHGARARNWGPNVLVYRRTLDARAALAKLDPVAHAALPAPKRKRLPGGSP
jgi:hypothetical protein